MRTTEITPLILTFNEAPNIRSTLNGVRWATRIVVVDSGSIDETISIAKEFPNVEVFYRKFDHFAEQCNFGMGLITTPWVLSLDADYICPPEFEREFSSLPDSSFAGFSAPFVYCVFGTQLRATLYPPRTVLYRRELANYQRDGHAHKVKIAGEVGKLTVPIRHDDRKPLARWISSQAKYAALEAEKIQSSPDGVLDWKDRLRTWIVVAPVLTFFYCLFAKRLILDGWPGIYYSLQRVFAELILSLTILDKRVRRD